MYSPPSTRFTRSAATAAPPTLSRPSSSTPVTARIGSPAACSRAETHHRRPSPKSASPRSPPPAPASESRRRRRRKAFGKDAPHGHGSLAARRARDARAIDRPRLLDERQWHRPARRATPDLALREPLAHARVRLLVPLPRPRALHE